MKRLEPRQLLVLAALGRNASIHSAARDLSLTQSAVSKALAEIEGSMGAVLFLRSRQGIEATTLGQLVLSRTAHLLDVLDRGPGHLGAENPILKIGYASDLHGMALGQAFVRWRQAQSLRLRLLEQAPHHGLQLLRQAELDAVLLDEPVAGWSEQRLIRNRMVPVLRQHHPLFAGDRPVTAKDLPALDWILPTAQASFHQALQKWVNEAGIEPSRSSREIPAGHGLSTVVAQSDALAWLPVAQAAYLQQTGALRALCLVAAPSLDVPAYWLWRQASQKDPVLQLAIAQFAQFLDDNSTEFGEQ